MRWMRSLVFGVIAMSSASACAGDAPGEIQMVADVSASGIEGQVTIRPVRPVERQGTPNARPYQARITVLDASGREISVVESDAEGRFRVPLPPGTYVLRPESPGRYPRASEQRVVVRDHALTHVSIVYDSGIR